MATIDIEVAGRRYPVSCRDGEEASLQLAASMVDRRAIDAAGVLGQLSESRLLLFAALMLADDVMEAQRGGPAPVLPLGDPGVDAATLGRIADRLEAIAAKLGHA